MLEASPTVIKARVHRGRAQLGVAMADRGLGAPDPKQLRPPSGFVNFGGFEQMKSLTGAEKLVICSPITSLWIEAKQIAVH